MNFIAKLFKTSENDLIELWKRLLKMPPDQLREICIHKISKEHGQLAFVTWYMRDEEEPIAWSRENGHFDYLMGGLNNLYKEDVVLLGLAKEIVQIRQTLKLILDAHLPNRR